VLLNADWSVKATVSNINANFVRRVTVALAPPKLFPDEVAFYDALANNESAVRELGDAILKKIAVEITDRLRKSSTVDWQVRESVRARLRILMRRTLQVSARQGGRSHRTGLAASRGSVSQLDSCGHHVATR